MDSEAVASELKALRALIVESLKNSAAALTTARTLTSQYQELRRVIDDIARESRDNWLRLDEMRRAELAKAKAVTDAAYMAELAAEPSREARLGADTIVPPPPESTNGDGSRYSSSPPPDESK